MPTDNQGPEKQESDNSNPFNQTQAQQSDSPQPKPIIGFGFLATHNPFYAISAVFTLYGLNVSFGNTIDPTQGWLQLQLFTGYMLLLAATGVLVVRYGQVWEDARSLFLLVLLLMVALSVSFDRVCLDDTQLALQFLATGLTFCLLLCELLLRVLKIRLPWQYRGVLYIQLTLLFGYPAWLGHLSLTDRIDELAWYTMGFASFAAISVVLLLPAAKKRERGLQQNGTPWNWPWYPWTLFFILGIGLGIRTLTITYSFDPAKGFTSGCQAYFLIPWLLAILLIWSECNTHRRDNRPWWRFILLPLGLFILALPGQPHSQIQANYVALLQESVGSPVQITAVLLLFFFAYRVCRGSKSAEWGFLAALGMLSITGPETLGINSFADLKLAPAMAGLFLLGGSALVRKSTPRLCFVITGMTAAISIGYQESRFVGQHGYFPFHFGLAAILLTGLLFEDALGKWLRRYASALLNTLAVATFLLYPFAFPKIGGAWHAVTTTSMIVLATTFWLYSKRLQDLAAVILCTFATAGHLAGYYFGTVFDLVFLRGKTWLAWGALFFLAGLLHSLAKGGQLKQLYQTLQQWHSAGQEKIDEP